MSRSSGESVRISLIRCTHYLIAVVVLKAVVIEARASASVPDQEGGKPNPAFQGGRLALAEFVIFSIVNHNKNLLVCTILAGDQFINSEATRERLHREFGGRAVAMEGGALAQVAERLGLPWLEVRALSDLAGHESQFDFGAFVDQVAKNSAIILRRILPVL
jgi:nucleoside phosphorylase